jgi:hypothetical protein
MMMLLLMLLLLLHGAANARTSGVCEVTINISVPNGRSLKHARYCR